MICQCSFFALLVLGFHCTLNFRFIVLIYLDKLGPLFIFSLLPILSSLLWIFQFYIYIYIYKYIYIFDHLKTSYCSPVFHYFSLIAFLDNFYCCIFIQLICSDTISNMPLISSSVFFMSGVQFSILIIDLGLFY